MISSTTSSIPSDDEEARALRQANGKANKTWRVLHRVTYVERPALMGIGRDPREPGSAGSQASESDQIAALTEKNVALETKLDEILTLLKNQQNSGS